MNKADLIERLQPVLAGAPADVVAVYLYGSWARGTARADSDVDLAFFRSRAAPATLAARHYDLAIAIERAIGREVDLVELNGAPPDLVHEVLRDGLIVLDRDPDLRVRLEVRARAEYLDMLPVLRRYRRERTAS